MHFRHFQTIEPQTFSSLFFLTPISDLDMSKEATTERFLAESVQTGRVSL